MAVKIENQWPLSSFIETKVDALKKTSVTDLISKDTKNQAASANKAEDESFSSWEKGSFIDIYT